MTWSLLIPFTWAAARRDWERCEHRGLRPPARPWARVSAASARLIPVFLASLGLRASITQAAKHLGTAGPNPARHASSRPESPQLVVSLADKPVARFRHLVPGPGEVDNRFRDDNPCLVGHLLQAWTFRVHLPHRAHLGAVVERARTPLARVPERPHALPISRRDRHLEG